MQKFIKLCSKVPAGLMIVPLMIGAIMYTFVPGLLGIGSFTSAVFSKDATASFVGLQLLAMGAQLKFKSIPAILGRGAVLLGTRFFAGVLAMLFFTYVVQAEVIAGVSMLAAIAAISNTNGSAYMLMCNLIGQTKDAAAAPLLSINNGPMFTMAILGLAGYASIKLIDIVAILLPMVIGMILGNISDEIAAFLKPGVIITMPLIGFTLGANIDLAMAFSAGISGVLLCVIVIIVGGILLFTTDILICRGNGAAGIAASAVAANAIIGPTMVAAIDPTWEKYAMSATAQVAVCVIITSVVIPIIFKIYTTKKGIPVDTMASP